MSAGVLVGDVLVLLLGVFMCVGPLMTRPSLQFGARVPPGYAKSPVVRRERRAYQWRSVLVAIGALAALVALGGHAPGGPAGSSSSSKSLPTWAASGGHTSRSRRSSQPKTGLPGVGRWWSPTLAGVASPRRSRPGGLSRPSR